MQVVCFKVLFRIEQLDPTPNLDTACCRNENRPLYPNLPEHRRQQHIFIFHSLHHNKKLLLFRCHIQPPPTGTKIPTGIAQS